MSCLRGAEGGVRGPDVSAAGFERFLAIAERAQWDEQDVDLAPDAAAWGRLAPETRQKLHRLLAGFAPAEASVADHLAPFEEAAEPVLAQCFAAQANDEARHARFFDRVAGDVLGIAGATARDRLRVMR